MTFSSYFRRFLLIFSCLVLFSCGDNYSDDTNSSSNQADSNEISVDEGGAEQEESGGEQATNNSNEQNDSVDTTESLPNESPSDELNGNDSSNIGWQKADGWTNFGVGSRGLSGNTIISFDVRALRDNIRGFVAVTYGPANDYDDLALIFHMDASGVMKARDGVSYESDMELRYSANVVYNVVMEIDFSSQLYDIFVTYPSGQRFPIRLSAAFRTTQQISFANQLVIYEPSNGEIEVSNFRINDSYVDLAAIGGNNTNTNNVVSNNNNMPITETPAQVNVDPNLPRIVVNNSSELSSALDLLQNGGVIQVNGGNYGCLDLRNREHSREAPLVIEGISSQPIFSGDECSYTVSMNNSSYIALRNISIVGGLDSVRVDRSSHIIVDSLDISGSRQAGIHVGINSSNVDIINSKINNTGLENPQWGECIYIGTGGSQNFPDETVNVWIENNDISSCGFGEAINIKPEVFNSTVLNNRVSNISPGSLEYSQYNQSAITVEGGRGSNPDNNHKPNESREIWIEGNTVSGVNGGRWNNGIMVGGTGVYVISNTLANIAERGVWVNRYGNLGMPVYLFGNTIDATVIGQGLDFSSSMNIIELEPANANPNRAQNWLPR